MRASPSPRTRRSRLLPVFLGLFLVLAGVSGWLWYHRHLVWLSSPEAALERLNAALESQDATLFAQVVDSESLARHLTEVLSQRHAPADHTNAELVLATILAVVQNTDFPPALREATLPPVPEDLRQQLLAHPFTLSGNDGMVCAVAAIRHPVLGEIPLRLLLEQEGTAWKFTRLLDARELADAYYQAQAEEIRRREEAEARAREEQCQALAHYLPELRCSGGVTRISGGTPLLVVSLQSAALPGPENIHDWGVTFVLTDPQGRDMVRPHVDVSTRLDPGTVIATSWSVDITEDEFLRLDRAGALTCRAEADYILLGDNRLFRRPRP